MRSLKPTLAAFTLALTVISPATWCKPPEAQPEPIGQVRVELNGLNLQNAADARTLLTRIEKAAYRACGGNPKLTRDYELMPRKTVEVYALCREDAVTRAIDQIGAAQLVQVYKEERQRRSATAGYIARPNASGPMPTQ